MGPLEPNDERRISLAAVHVIAGPGLQARINALASASPPVEKLVISPLSGFYDSEEIHFSVALPALQSLQLIDVAFASIELTTATTPKLEHLTLRNISDECELDVELPTLRTVSIHFWKPDGSAPPSSTLPALHCRTAPIAPRLFLPASLGVCYIHASSLVADPLPLLGQGCLSC